MMMVGKIKNILQDCRRALPALLLTLPLLTGCRGGNDLPDILPSGEAEKIDGNVFLDLSIGINDGGGNSGTRAFGAGEDNTFEPPVFSYEIVNTLRVVIVRHDVVQNDGSKKNIIEHNRMVNVNPEYADNNLNLITGYYVLYDNLRFNLIGGEMKTIYLFANEETVRDQQKFDFTDRLAVGKEFPKAQVEGLLIKRYQDEAYIDNDDPVSDDGVIKHKYNVPMSEAFDVYVPAPRGYGEDLYSQTLFMTRSLIKFSFSIACDQGDLTDEDWAKIQNLGMKLSGVKITNLANSSYYLPRDTKYNPWKYWPEPEGSTFFDLTPKTGSDLPALSEINTDKRKITEFGVPQNPGASECIFMFKEPIKIVKQGSGEVSHVAPAIYLPESKVTGVGNDLYYVSLIFDDESLNDQYAPVPLQGLNGENDFTKDIPRNTHVKVNMTMNLHKQELSATVTLFPYTAVSLNPEFGFGVPVMSVGIITEDEQPVVAEGQTISLVGFVSPEDANNKNIVWTSSDTSVATVSAEGTVKGIKAGTVVITATAVDDPTKYATCTITVKPKTPVDEISLDHTEWRGNVEETINLVATITPKEATNKEIIWKTDDKNIAEVSPYGTVKAMNPGRTTITATSADNEEAIAFCTVTVNPRILVTGITLSPTSLSIVEGDQSNLTATVTPQDATNQDLEWESDNDAVATVSSYGLVTAITTGSANITVTAKDGSGIMSAKCKVTVTKKTPVTSVSLSRTSMELRETKTGSLTATVSPSGATNRNVVWTSDNPYVATIANNTVTAVNEGTANITVTSVDDPTKSATCKVTVLPKIPVDKIIIWRRADGAVTSWTTSTIGGKHDIRARIVPYDATVKTVEWKSSDERVATIEPIRIDSSSDPADDGTSIVYVVAKGKGHATITVTSVNNPDVSATFDVTVN